MEKVVDSERTPITFNSPFEAGIRAVTLLGAAHPRSFDLQRLVALDHLLVHTGDVGGPESLHPDAPMHSAEFLVRRRLVEQGLLLMMTRHLVERDTSADGFRYRAGENAAPFLASLQAEYLKSLNERARWLIAEYGNRSDTEFRATMRRFFDRWIEEFHAAESSLGRD